MAMAPLNMAMEPLNMAMLPMTQEEMPTPVTVTVTKTETETMLRREPVPTPTGGGWEAGYAQSQFNEMIQQALSQHNRWQGEQASALRDIRDTIRDVSDDIAAVGTTVDGMARVQAEQAARDWNPPFALAYAVLLGLVGIVVAVFL